MKCEQCATNRWEFTPMMAGHYMSLYSETLSADVARKETTSLCIVPTVVTVSHPSLINDGISGVLTAIPVSTPGTDTARTLKHGHVDSASRITKESW